MTNSHATATTSVRAPYDGTVIAEIPVSSTEDVNRAVERAASIGPDALPLWRRAEILDSAARTLAADRESFARTIALEAAKPIATAREGAAYAVVEMTETRMIVLSG